MRHIFILLFIFIFFQGFSQVGPSFSLYLIGDAGEDTVPGKALLMLKEELIQHQNSAVVFLGDNVYPNGLIANKRISGLHLESQLQVTKEYKGQVYFIPGNHDWDAQGRHGLKKLKAQEKYVANYLNANTSVLNKSSTSFFPKDGFPGPETVLLSPGLRIIFIDTQWFLHTHKKSKLGTKRKTVELFYMHLDSIMNYSKLHNEQIIITAHHPLYTNGQHARSRQPVRFLINYTPLKIFGLMGADRLLSQDITDPTYKKMRKKILSIINKYDNVIYASGHDHTMQFFKNGSNRYIVSGCGSKLTSLRKKKKFESVFQEDTETGFVRLDFYADGKNSTTILRVNEKELKLEGF